MEKMEKINGVGVGVGLCSNPLWYVISALFIFSFLSFWCRFPFLMLDQNLAQWSSYSNYYAYSIPHFDASDNPIVTPSTAGGKPPSVSYYSDKSVSNQMTYEKTDASSWGEENVNATENANTGVDPISSDPCSGRYVYVHNLPSKFNTGLLKECRNLNQWTDMCLRLSNGGMGPRIRNTKEGFFPRQGWFSTDQFALDVIFHNRMKQYKCLTDNSSSASAIFVPFYAGLDVGRYLWGFNTSIRDSASHDLVRWLASRPEWKVMGGRDHFLVGGRVTWDFRRHTDDDSEWGNNLMLTAEANNMSALLIESSPWHYNEHAIPYPTYFHPSTDNEITQWQNKLRKHKKRYLFSFAGAPRHKQSGSIRGHIIQQCQISIKEDGLCKLLECYKHGDSCQPTNVMQLFQNSDFCLQPPGDSYTRKSAFDSILAGCIPVFFHPESAYTQYVWHLPQNYHEYSVLIPENQIRNGEVSIAQTLSGIPKKKVEAMKEVVISLIPNLIYADPRSRLETHEDAFDISVRRILQMVNEVRREQQTR